MREFDYIIIGGGCAGLSLAYELEINNKLKNGHDQYYHHYYWLIQV